MRYPMSYDVSLISLSGHGHDEECQITEGHTCYRDPDTGTWKVLRRQSKGAQRKERRIRMSTSIKQAKPYKMSRPQKRAANNPELAEKTAAWRARREAKKAERRANWKFRNG